MKIRDSGMPDEALWATFFDAEAILDCLGFGPEGGPPGLADVVDLGCGYGTFTIPAARRTHGTVHAFDIEAAMVEVTQRKAHALGLENVVALRRDVLAEGTGLASESCGYVMAFNVLPPPGPRSCWPKPSGFWGRGAASPSFTGSTTLLRRAGPRWTSAPHPSDAGRG